jgi:hypothetical protein
MNTWENEEYKKAFSEWRKLHQYRYNTGKMGKKYVEAYRKLQEVSRG